MNLENMNAAIRIMENVRDEGLKLDMDDWMCWDDPATDSPKTMEDFHTCGTAACFAGYVGLSKEFKDWGGRVGPGGYPACGPENSRNELFGDEAIAEFLEITPGNARQLCGTSILGIYPVKDDSDITPQMVIDQLIKMRDAYIEGLSADEGGD